MVYKNSSAPVQEKDTGNSTLFAQESGTIGRSMSPPPESNFGALQRAANSSPQVAQLQALQGRVGTGTPLQLSEDETEEEYTFNILTASKRECFDELGKIAKLFIEGEGKLGHSKREPIKRILQKLWGEIFIEQGCDRKETYSIISKVVERRLRKLRQKSGKSTRSNPGANSNARLAHIEQEIAIELEAIKRSSNQGGASWEKNVLTDESLDSDKFIDETRRDIDPRTGTRYGYFNGGGQGPHTLARCLGLSIRDKKLKGIRDRLKDGSLQKDHAISEVDAMYGCYAESISDSLRDHLLGSSENYHPDKVEEHAGIVFTDEGQNKKKYGEYAGYYRAAPTQTNQEKWKEEHGVDKYDASGHYMEAFHFYQENYRRAKANTSLSFEQKVRYMVMFGQILCDLHPMATSFNNNAPKSELSGGGEAAARDKYLDCMDEESGEEQQAKMVDLLMNDSESDNGKGLIDQSSIKYVPDEIMPDFTGFLGNNLFHLNRVGGMGEGSARKVSQGVRKRINKKRKRTDDSVKRSIRKYRKLESGDRV